LEREEEDDDRVRVEVRRKKKKKRGGNRREQEKCNPSKSVPVFPSLSCIPWKSTGKKKKKALVILS
jgi:hypothetical protein